MEEIEIWFEEEFGHLGFSLTPIMYNPFDFTPMKGVMFENEDGLRLTRIRVTPALANDLSGGFVPLPDWSWPVQELRELIRQEIYRFLDEPVYVNQSLNKPKDFTPKKKITKLKFND
jgi:hypothetical protein